MMTKLWRAMPILAVALFVAACTAATVNSAPPATRMTTIGPVIADARGMTLYTYDADRPGESRCYGLCALAWPPAEAPAGVRRVGSFTLVTRTDGTKQWAYKGAPLYRYFRDAKAGDTLGDGDEGVWHAARR